MAQKRASGVLMHITSLPSRYGVGDLGPAAYKFADFLANSVQSCWQVLPLNPSADTTCHCPYYGLSAFAAAPLLISPDLLYRDGLLSRSDIQNPPSLPKNSVFYRRAIPYKRKILSIAFKKFTQKPIPDDYHKFCKNSELWLDDYAMFTSLSAHFATSYWPDWPKNLRDRSPKALQTMNLRLKKYIDREKFIQYTFARQWSALKTYVNSLKINIIGDIPIYLAHNSADVWANPHLFKLTKSKKPAFVSGTPPDNFCNSGQLWGHPVYDWTNLKKTNFTWWLQRIKHNLSLFDTVRLDHFRGFIAYWQVPAHHKTADKGKWIKAPKDALFEKVFAQFPPRRFIVEDLGLITPAVYKFINQHNLCGMRVLQFAFENSADSAPHWPKNHPKNSIAYTGTHDNNTIIGWYNTEATPQQKQNLSSHLHNTLTYKQLHWKLIDLVMSSNAKLAIIPMQDILGLDQRARMNTPGTVKGNWSWRITSQQLNSPIAKRLLDMTLSHHRAQ